MSQATAYLDDFVEFAQCVSDRCKARYEQAKLASAARKIREKKAAMLSEIRESRLAIVLGLMDIKSLKTTIRNEAEHWPKLRKQLQDSSEEDLAASQQREINLTRECADAAQQARYDLYGTRLDCLVPCSSCSKSFLQDSLALTRDAGSCSTTLMRRARLCAPNRHKWMQSCAEALLHQITPSLHLRKQHATEFSLRVTS